MDILNEYLEEYEFDPSTKTALRKYFHHCRWVCGELWLLTSATGMGGACMSSTTIVVCFPSLYLFSSALTVCRALRREEQFKQLITTHMSPELQGIVTSHCYGRYLENIPFLRYDTKHMRGIRKLRAEEEKQMFITQVWWMCCCAIPRQKTCALLYASWIKNVLMAARHPDLLRIDAGCVRTLPAVPH